MVKQEGRLMASESTYSSAKRGSLVRNAHGALYRVHEVMPDEGGCSAVVEYGGKSGGVGLVVWLDERDFRPGGLEVTDE